MAQRTSLLTDIHPGMEVYDRYHQKIGTVQYVRVLDDIIIDAHTMDDETFGAALAELSSTVYVPVDTRERLLQGGFAVLDAGPFRPRRYILPEQIRSVSLDQVVLNVTRDRLLLA